MYLYSFDTVACACVLGPLPQCTRPRHSALGGGPCAANTQRGDEIAANSGALHDAEASAGQEVWAFRADDKVWLTVGQSGEELPE